MSFDVTISKTPFNDKKHIPTRAEIELELGVIGAINLKEFEHKLDLLSSVITWSMYWFGVSEGWSSRASCYSSVLCILHFYKKHFIATVSIPLVHEEEFRNLKNLTDTHRKRFDHFTLSPGSKWVSFRVGRKEDIESLLAVMKKKISLLRIREEVSKKKRESSDK